MAFVNPSIPLSIPEGTGKATGGDRRRCFEIARGAAPACGAIPAVREVCCHRVPEEGN